MNIFIASPLFNPPQIQLIEQIEQAITRAGHEFYSARLHSGSDKLTPEQRKDLAAWDPVFESNVRGLDDADLCIAVLEYRQPEEVRLELVRYDQQKSREAGFKPGDKIPGELLALPELPDAGTVWEMGYLAAQGKPVIGFHSQERPAHLNLMLTHGCQGLLLGLPALEEFLQNPGGESLVWEWGKKHLYPFGWTACSAWDAASRQVE